MQRRHFTFDAPSRWAPAIIFGDRSNVVDQDRANLEAWLSVFYRLHPSARLERCDNDHRLERHFIFDKSRPDGGHWLHTDVVTFHASEDQPGTD